MKGHEHQIVLKKEERSMGVSALISYKIYSFDVGGTTKTDVISNNVQSTHGLIYDSYLSLPFSKLIEH